MSLMDAIRDAFSGGGGQDRSRGKEAGYGGSSNRNVTSSPRPELRPDDFAEQVTRAKRDFTGSDGGGSDDYKKMMAAPKDYNDPQNLAVLDDVPYFKGLSVSNRPKPDGLSGFLQNLYVNSKKDALTDLRLGIGSLTGGGLPGFKKTLESMGYAGLEDQAYKTAFDNYKERTEMTMRENKPGEGDNGSSGFMDSFDPCPEGYQTDPVTGMCVPVMDATPEPVPLPDLPSGGGGGMTSPVLPLMDYTQPINYTAPRISPPVPQGIAGIPRTPIIG